MAGIEPKRPVPGRGRCPRPPGPAARESTTLGPKEHTAFVFNEWQLLQFLVTQPEMLYATHGLHWQFDVEHRSNPCGPGASGIDKDFSSHFVAIVQYGVNDLGVFGETIRQGVLRIVSEDGIEGNSFVGELWGRPDCKRTGMAMEPASLSR